MVGEGAEHTGCPHACEVAFNESQNRFVVSEPSPKIYKNRTASVSPNRTTGPPVKVGRVQSDGLDFSDSISLIKQRPGVNSR
jgi:predicted RNA-binding protein